MRLLLWLFLILFSFQISAQTYYSLGSSSFDDVNNWDLNPGGGGGNPSSVTDGTSDFVIQTGHDITAPGSAIIINNLTIESGATLEMSGVDMTVNGTTTIDGTLSDLDQSSASRNIYAGDVIIGSTGSLNSVHNCCYNVKTHDFQGGITNNGTLYIDLRNQSEFNGLSDQIVVANSTINFGNVTINQNVELQGTSVINLGTGGNFTLGSATFTNNSTGQVSVIGDLFGDGQIVNGANAVLRFWYTNKSASISLDASGSGNTVRYYRQGDTQEIFSTTYENLYFQGIGTKTISVGITINGDFTINANSISNSLTVNYPSSINLGGNLTITGAGTYLNGTTLGSILLNGSSTQAITDLNSNVSSDEFEVDSFILNNLSDVLVSANILVNANLAIDNGIISLLNSILSLGPSISISSTGTLGNSNKIETDGTSIVRQYIDSDNSFTLPIGTSGVYTPITISTTTGTIYSSPGTNYIDVLQDANEEGSVLNSGYSLLKYWSISSTNMSNINGNIQFTYDDMEIPVTSDEDLYFVLYNDGVDWNTNNGVVPASNLGTFSFTNASSINGNYTAGQLKTFFNTFVTNWVPSNSDIAVPHNPSYLSSYNYSFSLANISGTGGDAKSTGVTGGVTISGLTPGDTYQLEISGDFPAIFFNGNTTPALELMTVEQWGDISWQSMNNAFNRCQNLTITATDAPDLSAVTDMTSMFQSCNSLTGDFTGWDVSNVQNMSSLFSAAIGFDENITGWDVSSVTNMSSMFDQAQSFNQAIGSWNVSNVQDMSLMFFDARTFNQNINSWNVSSVTTMELMFEQANDFNMPIDSWNVSGVTNMREMFTGAISFNQPLNSWNVSNVTDMNYMFNSTDNFNQSLDNWDVSGVTDMSYMFEFAVAFNQSLGSWDVSAVTDMTGMLDNSALSVTNYDATLIGWEALTTLQSGVPFGASGLTYCSGATARTNLISNNSWTISGDALNCAFITTWITSDNQITIPTTGTGYNYDITWTNLTNAGVGDGTVAAQTGNYTISGLENGSLYQLEISGTFPRIFFNGSTEATKLQTIEKWGEILWTSMANAFYGCTNLNVVATDIPNLSAVTSLSGMFRGVTGFNVNISNWEVSSITDFSYLFMDTSFDQNINGWTVSAATNMSFMFSNTPFNQPLGNWDVSGVTDMSSMFLLASSFNQDLSGWNVISVTNMGGMFSQSAFNNDISLWDVSNVIGMSSMFSNSDFNQDISGWDVSSVQTMRAMFLHSSPVFNQDISGWNVGAVTDMSFMFSGASGFDQNLGGWDVSAVTDMTGMLDNSGLSINNYDNTLIGWSNLPSLQNGINLGASSLIYCEGSSERQSLISNNSWSINGDAEDCSSVRVVAVYDGNDPSGVLLTNNQSTPINLGSASVGTTISRVIAVENNGTGTLNISSVDVSSTDISTDFNTSTSIASGAFITFTVTINGTIAGDFGGTVTVNTDDPVNSNFIIPISYSYVATPIPDIIITFGGSPLISGTSTIDFGSTDVGANVTQIVIIENTGTDDLVITDIQLADGVVFTLPALNFPITLAPGETLNLSLIMDASLAGLFEDQLIITSNDLDEGSFTVGLTGEVIGTTVINVVDVSTNQVIITGQDVNLGQTNINVSVDKNFGIENLSSTEILQIMSITVDNPVFEIVNAPTSIDPSSRAEFTIRLQTNAIGIHTGLVTVTTNINNFSFGVIGEVLSEGDPPLTIYNVVTPNGDGIHDFFKIVNIEAYPSNKVSVFDRWGGKVFEATNYNNTSNFFNGITDSGDELITGNYYYFIDKGNGDKPERGFIFLKR